METGVWFGYKLKLDRKRIVKEITNLKKILLAAEINTNNRLHFFTDQKKHEQ